MIDPGKYKARATGAEMGFTNNGDPQVAVAFELLDHPGQFLTWYGGFSTEVKGQAKKSPCDRTFESLRYCGWTGDDLTDLGGIESNEVEIVVEHNEWEGKITAKVAWVNLPGSGVALKNVMPPNQRAAFAAKMKGAAVASRKAIPANPTPATVAKKSASPPPGAGDAWEEEASRLGI